jgi:hypothetical protein
MPNRKRFGDAEREQRRAEDRDRVLEAARQLLSSEGWQRWVRVRARNGLSRYSLSNQLLIALACPQATFVAGFRAWLELGYCVCKGERAIRIMAPMPIKDREPDGPDQEVGEGKSRSRVLFRAVSVFDASQVTPLESGEPTRLAAPSEPLTGESHVELLVPLEAFATSIGFTVSFEALGGRVGGFCDSTGRRVVVDAGLCGNARVRVLVHELAHALGVGYEQFGRERAEVIVDTVALIVCGSVGLDVGGESIPYVAGWGEDGALEAITEFAATIDTLARRLEDVLAAPAAEARAA